MRPEDFRNILRTGPANPASVHAFLHGMTLALMGGHAVMRRSCLKVPELTLKCEN